MALRRVTSEITHLCNKSNIYLLNPTLMYEGVKPHLLTPEAAVLRPHRDVNAVVLGSTVCQRLIQSHCVQHKTVIEAAGDEVHLGGERCNFEQPATMGIF